VVRQSEAETNQLLERKLSSALSGAELRLTYASLTSAMNHFNLPKNNLQIISHCKAKKAYCGTRSSARNGWTKLLRSRL